MIDCAYDSTTGTPGSLVTATGLPGFPLPSRWPETLMNLALGKRIYTHLGFLSFGKRYGIVPKKYPISFLDVTMIFALHLLRHG